MFSDSCQQAGEWKDFMDDMKKQDVVSGLVISEEVIAAIALNAAKDVEGVSGFAARPRDLQALLHIGDDMLKSVRVWVNENEIKLHLYLLLKGGTKIPAVSAQVQRAVKNAVQNMTGRVVTKVNISIVGGDFSEIAQAQKGVLSPLQRGEEQKAFYAASLQKPVQFRRFSRERPVCFLSCGGLILLKKWRTSMTRRQAREQAFTLIFEKSFHPEITVEEMISMAVEARYLQTDEFAVLLAKTADEQQPEIDSIIENNAIGWKKDRISRVSLSLLRLALCEMLFIEEVPTNVSINEAVELAKLYASQEDAAFINGVLGAAARKLEAQ